MKIQVSNPPGQGQLQQYLLLFFGSIAALIELLAISGLLFGIIQMPIGLHFLPLMLATGAIFIAQFATNRIAKLVATDKVRTISDYSKTPLYIVMKITIMLLFGVLSLFNIFEIAASPIIIWLTLLVLSCIFASLDILLLTLKWSELYSNSTARTIIVLIWVAIVASFLILFLLSFTAQQHAVCLLFYLIGAICTTFLFSTSKRIESHEHADSNMSVFKGESFMDSFEQIPPSQLRPKTLWAVLGLLTMLSPQFFSTQIDISVFALGWSIGILGLIVFIILKQEVPHLKCEQYTSFGIEAVVLISIIPGVLGLWSLFAIALLIGITFALTFSAILHNTYKYSYNKTFHISYRLAITFGSIFAGQIFELILLNIVPEDLIILLSGVAALFALSLAHITDPIEWPFWADIHSEINNLPTHADVSIEKSEAGRIAQWERICQAVCEEYHLSKRESDVLPYLARGRNAASIADKLFVSSHTVHTHIYNIYRKTGVHNQQELIDLVDKTFSSRKND